MNFCRESVHLNGSKPGKLAGQQSHDGVDPKAIRCVFVVSLSLSSFRYHHFVIIIIIVIIIVYRYRCGIVSSMS